MIIVNLILYVSIVKNPRTSEQSLGVNLKNLTGEINALNIVEQKFKPNDSEIAKLEIFFSTYDRENSGNTNVQIEDEAGNSIYTYNIDNSAVKDNEYMLIDVKDVKVDIKQEYTIRISSELKEGGITAWQDEDKQLVAKIGYQNTFDLSDLIQVNIVFLLINVSFIGLIGYLRK